MTTVIHLGTRCDDRIPSGAHPRPLVSSYPSRVVAIAHLNEIILVVVHDLGLRLGSLLTRRHCRATSMWRRAHPAAGRRHDGSGWWVGVFAMGCVVVIVVGCVS